MKTSLIIGVSISCLLWLWVICMLGQPEEAEVEIQWPITYETPMREPIITEDQKRLNKIENRLRWEDGRAPHVPEENNPYLYD